MKKCLVFLMFSLSFGSSLAMNESFIFIRNVDIRQEILNFTKEARNKLFITAVKLGLDDEVKKWINEGVDVNQKIEAHELTPLHFAVLKDKLSICKILLSAGANLEAKDHLDHTPFDCAVLFGIQDIAEFLIEYSLTRVNTDQKKRILTLLNCLRLHEDQNVNSLYTPCILDSLKKGFKAIIREENLSKVQKKIFHAETMNINPQSPALKNYLKKKYCTPCNYCGVIVENLKRCTQCKAIQYCSIECQAKDWAKHKFKCKK